MHTILQELADYIKKFCKINITDIINFLLGEKLDFKLSDSSLYMLYSGDRTLSSNYLQKLATSYNWRIERLMQLEKNFTPNQNLISQLEDNIRILFLKYFPDDLSNPDFSTMVQSLVFLHFFNTDDIDDYFYPCILNTCANYIPWDEKEAELHQLLISDHLIFITGLPASGKKQLLKHYIENDGKWNDVFWLSENLDYPLAKRISNIRFLCEGPKTSIKTEDTLGRLSNKNTSSLLVIDMPLINDDDLCFIKNNFTKLNLNIIIVTRTVDNLSSFKSINLNHRPVQNLRKIFFTYASNDFFTDADFDKLCSIISYNPFIISLLAKSLDQKPFSIDTLLNINSWYINEKNLPKLHSPYHDNGKKPALKITTLAQRILDRYDENFLKDAGSKLSIYAKDEIPANILQRYLPSSDIQKALTWGLLQYVDTDKTILQMPSIIADIIWQKYPLNYSNYKAHLASFFNELSIGQSNILSYDILYKHILTTTYRFHFQITTMKSRIDKNQKADFIEWNHILCNLILYFIRLGNTNAARKVLNHLYFYEIKSEMKSDLIPSLQMMEREIFQLHIEFAQNEFPAEEILDKAILLLLNLSEHITSRKQSAIYISIIKKIYNFIIDLIDASLLEQLLAKNIDSAQKLVQKTVTCLQSFLNNSLIKESPDICLYYQMLYYYFTKQNRNAKSCYKKLKASPDLSFQSRLWNLYFDIMIPFQEAKQKKAVYTAEQLRYFSMEYSQLFKSFHNKISSLNTTTLFYCCSSLICMILPPAFPNTRKIAKCGLTEAYEDLTTQTILSKENMEYLTDIFDSVSHYSKLKSSSYLTFL